jgi:hypothetical protein
MKAKKFHIILSTMLILFFLIVTASAQTAPPGKKTLFVLTNVNASVTYPLYAYVIFGNELILAETLEALPRGFGPVGLAVDVANETVFVSYEDSDIVDAYDARNMMPQGSITLQGSDDLAGMVVHQDRGILYVVDRGEPTIFEYDTSTFNPLTSWTAPNCLDGAIALDLLGDVLYVTCGNCSTPGSGTFPTKTIHMYDIDTHAEVDTFTQTYEAVGIAVADYPDRMVLTGGHDTHDYVTAYYPDTATEDYVFMGDGVKGVSLDPAQGYGFFALGYGGVITSSSINVVDITTLQVLNSYPLEPSWSPTDCLAHNLDFGGSVKTISASHPGGSLGFGELLTLSVRVTNRKTTPVQVLPLAYLFDPDQLEFLSADPEPDDLSIPGEISWNDLTLGLKGSLSPGDFLDVELQFVAQTKDCDGAVEGMTVARSSNAVFEAAGSYSYRVTCDCVTSVDCNNGLYCDGEETCDLDGNCALASVRPCPEGGWFCNEDTDSCDPLVVDDDDDDDDDNDDDTAGDDDDDAIGDDDDNDDDDGDDDDNDDETTDDDDDDDNDDDNDDGCGC